MPSRNLFSDVAFDEEEVHASVPNGEICRSIEQCLRSNQVILDELDTVRYTKALLYEQLIRVDRM